eukprot:GEMP01041407.1.p1 GENE.GEMP01041407.1~~GEMP01041407.1.p1  ORF type:complete len:403 (+),score=72.10 GEMP01041407.1:32-1210(+)
MAAYVVARVMIMQRQQHALYESRQRRERAARAAAASRAEWYRHTREHESPQESATDPAVMRRMLYRMMPTGHEDADIAEKNRGHRCTWKDCRCPGLDCDIPEVTRCAECGHGALYHNGAKGSCVRPLNGEQLRRSSPSRALSPSLTPRSSNSSESAASADTIVSFALDTRSQGVNSTPSTTTGTLSVLTGQDVSSAFSEPIASFSLDVRSQGLNSTPSTTTGTLSVLTGQDVSSAFSEHIASFSLDTQSQGLKSTPSTTTATHSVLTVQDVSSATSERIASLSPDTRSQRIHNTPSTTTATHRNLPAFSSRTSIECPAPAVAPLEVAPGRAPAARVAREHPRTASPSTVGFSLSWIRSMPASRETSGNAGSINGTGFPQHDAIRTGEQEGWI